MAGDRRQMERRIHVEAKRHRRWGKRTESKGCFRPEEWQGNHRGRSHTRLSLHRKLLRHTGQVCFQVYGSCRHTAAGSHKSRIRAVAFFSDTVGKGLSNHCVVSLTKQHLAAFSLNHRACSTLLYCWHLRTCTPACRNFIKDMHGTLTRRHLPASRCAQWRLNWT